MRCKRCNARLVYRTIDGILYEECDTCRTAVRVPPRRDAPLDEASPNQGGSWSWKSKPRGKARPLGLA